MKEFDADELAGFNGENGNPTYVAYDGKVYDVSESKLWRKGQHMNRHRSGDDLTSDMQAAPHDFKVLECGRNIDSQINARLMLAFARR